MKLLIRNKNHKTRRFFRSFFPLLTLRNDWKTAFKESCLGSITFWHEFFSSVSELMGIFVCEEGEYSLCIIPDQLRLCVVWSWGAFSRYQSYFSDDGLSGHLRTRIQLTNLMLLLLLSYSFNLTPTEKTVVVLGGDWRQRKSHQGSQKHFFFPLFGFSFAISPSHSSWKGEKESR